jgi:uncharacterized protein
VRLRVALVFGVFAMVGAYLGAQLATLFSDAAQLTLFAVVMLVAACFMFHDNNKEESDEDEGDSGAENFSVAGVFVGCAAGLTVLGVAIGVLTK